MIVMNGTINTLSAVVEDFVASLSEERKTELKTVLLSHMMTTSWPWYEEVLSLYLRGPCADALIQDIETHHPGGDFMNGAEQTRGVPIYEAKMILWEAQKAVSNSSSLQNSNSAH
jgi:hypothetical protein